MDNNKKLCMIGERIKKEREAQGMTLEQLAQALNTTRQSVSKWEKGLGTLDMDSVLRMCEIFGCEIGYLACEFDQKTRENADICASTGLTEDAVDRLHSYCNQLQEKTPIDGVEEIVSYIICSMNFQIIIDELGSIMENDYIHEQYFSKILDKSKQEISILAKHMNAIWDAGLEVLPQFEHNNISLYNAKQASMNMINEVECIMREKILLKAFPNPKGKRALEYMILELYDIGKEIQSEEDT